ncbi:MAG TPA: sigma 54-interacting transcriptional regulator, partial [Kofleriaceae bacterium]
MTTELETVRRERDFYRSLTQLGDHDTIEPLLREAITLLASRTGAREAMIEVIGDDIDGPPQVAAYGCDGERVAAISSFVSRGIIGEAMATGTTVVTANAAQDPRFFQFESVRRNQLEAVLCVPIGRTMHVGVLYLQGKQGASEFQPYGLEVQGEVELAARMLAGPLERLLSRRDTPVAEPSRAKVSDDAFSAVRGRSQVMADVVERLRLAAPLDVHVLLTGPSGVGKTLLANAVHLASRRRGGPFVEINCAALPENLLENELFGSEPGAYSGGPRSGIKGKVEA